MSDQKRVILIHPHEELVIRIDTPWNFEPRCRCSECGEDDAPLRVYLQFRYNGYLMHFISEASCHEGSCIEGATESVWSQVDAKRELIAERARERRLFQQAMDFRREDTVSQRLLMEPVAEEGG